MSWMSGACILQAPLAGSEIVAVYVVRAFIKLRARKLEALEKSVVTLDASTRKQFEEVYLAIRALMAPPAMKPRPIGFTADLDENR